jgi:hypothetical protein
MQIHRTIDRDKHFIYTTITGEVTMREILAAMAKIATDRTHDPDMPGVVDLREATMGMTDEEFIQIAEKVKTSPKVVGKSRRALLVNTDFSYGMSRMFQAFAADGPTEYRVFRDEHEAREWAAGAEVAR